MHRRDGFTLLEICIAVFIALLMLLMAVPSIQGLFSEREIKRTFDNFSALVIDAQTRAISEQRAYLIEWDDEGLLLRPVQPSNRDEAKGITRIDFGKHEAYDIDLPAALMKEPPKSWVFWPTGTCEAAKISYNGAAGSWTAEYNPLTVRPMLLTNAR